MNIKIGYRNFKVVKKPRLVDLPDELYGKIKYDTEEILISEKYNKCQQQCTLLHEIIHGIFENRDITVENEEQVTLQLSKGLYELFLDNPHVFKMESIDSVDGKIKSIAGLTKSEILENIKNGNFETGYEKNIEY